MAYQPSTPDYQSSLTSALQNFVRLCSFFNMLWKIRLNSANFRLSPGDYSTVGRCPSDALESPGPDLAGSESAESESSESETTESGSTETEAGELTSTEPATIGVYPTTLEPSGMCVSSNT